MLLDTLYYYLFRGALFVLALLFLFSFIRALIGPRIADRLISVNMIGTQVIVSIAILSLALKESYLADIAIIYSIISFLSVVVLCKVFLGVHYAKKAGKKDD